MIIAISSFRTKEFSCQLPDVEFSISENRAEVRVQVTKSGSTTEVFHEFLFPDHTGKVCLQDLDLLMEPYADRWLTFQLTVTVEEQAVSTDGSDKMEVTGSETWSTSVVSCKANIMNASAEDWCNSHFLTLIDGAKTTAPGFLEYLYFVGSLSGSPYFKAYYSDNSNYAGGLSVTSLGDNYGRIDVSPNKFVSSGRKLVKYEIHAGERVQEYVVDQLIEPDVAPVLMFWNSFGVQELAYCTGELKQVASFDRKQARIGRKKMTYSLEEKETFKADTGYLTFPMANWWREVLRSKEINVVPVINGAVDVLNTKPVIIISEKHELSNAPDALPRITFEYEYAERNHNYFDVRQEGRIFDDTFDDTFN